VEKLDANVGDGMLEDDLDFERVTDGVKLRELQMM
jgi:hypothetical protein